MFINKLYCSFILALSCSFCTHCNGQCCSANPVAGSVNVGTLTPHTFRAISYYRYHNSNQYFEGNHPSSLHLLKYADYNYIGLVMAYGITKEITIESEAGYYIDKTEVYRLDPEYILKGWGPANGVVSIKYGLLNKNDFELAVAGGLKYPLAQQQQEISGVQLPPSVQASTGAFGGVVQLFIRKEFANKELHLFSINRMEINSTNIINYKTGNLFELSQFISKSINEHWTGIIQVREEVRGYDYRENARINFSGGHSLFIAPQINYTLAQKWNLSVLMDLPLYQYYNGTQLSSKYGLAVNITRGFNIKNGR